MARMKLPALNRLVLWAMAVCLLVAACSRVTAGAAVSSNATPQGMHFTDLVVSPDGSRIVFEYNDPAIGVAARGLGMYEIATATATRIPFPAGRRLSMPSFSEDGQRLITVQGAAGTMAGNQLAEVDLRTMQVREVMAAEHPVYYPVYQPGTGNILYWLHWMHSSFALYLLNPVSRTQLEQIPQADGFNYVMRPFFTGQNDIIFQGAGRIGNNALKVLQETRNPGGPVAYKMSLGGTPQIFSVEAERNRTLIDSAGFPSLSASQNGYLVIFTSSRTTPMNSVKLRQELYSSIGRKEMQLTNLGVNIVRSYMSADGTKVAFIANLNNPERYDLFIYDMNSRNLNAANIPSRIFFNNP